MPQKSKTSYEKKIRAVKEYNAGKGSYESISKKYDVNSTTLRGWIRKFESMGEEGLIIRNKNKRYNKDLKEKAVFDYINQKGSLHEICKKYQISSDKQLRNWVKVYNDHKEFRSTGETGEIYMIKGRKTTFEERIEIVGFCIETGKNYAKTIEKHQVSYQQIYSWIKKFEQGGVENLSDRRGKAKPEIALTEIDKLKAENRLLAAKNKDLEMENLLLKKLKELERSCR